MNMTLTACQWVASQPYPSIHVTGLLIGANQLVLNIYEPQALANAMKTGKREK